jgi:nicotinamide mononucleotide transporter
MNLIDYMIEPYSGYSGMEIAMEAIAMLTGILSVYFAKRENILVFPAGLISTGLYVWICTKVLLYADAGINAYYFVMSLYGWYVWKHPDAGKGDRPITRLSKKESALVLVGFACCFLLIAQVLIHLTDSDVPLIDALTTSIFFVAMWLMARKKIEHWSWWIIGDLISIPLYIYKGLAITSVQYVVFLALALAGWISWRKSTRP